MTTEVQESQGPYKGNYRADVYEEASENATLGEQVNEEGLQDEETISLTTKKADDHDYKKRYDDLKKHYDTKVSEWKEEKEFLETEKGIQSVVDDSAASESNLEVEQFKHEYPEVYNVVDKISTQKTSEEVEQLKAEVNRLNQREEQLQAKGAYQELLALHSDFPEIKQSEDFREWLEDQPPSIAEGITSNSSDVRWASRVLDLYKADKGLNKKRGRPRASAADSVTRTSSKTVSTNSNANKKVWTTAEIRKLKPHEFEKFEDELDQARVEGRIV